MGRARLAFDKVKPPIFDKAIAKHPNIKVACQADGDYDKATGQKVAADCLQAHPDIDVWRRRPTSRPAGPSAH